ncbi:MAG: hypothetical protein BWY46_01563 [Firmicutes bacterium ADurb.Bin300]|nr:MAG: hypothetical protein BWY46_01563 [Firmicutes bacterium ADurb.Bin300]
MNCADRQVAYLWFKLFKLLLAQNSKSFNPVNFAPLFQYLKCFKVIVRKSQNERTVVFI